MSLKAGSGHFPSVSFLIHESQLALHHISQAVKTDGVWPTDQLDIAKWVKVMRFKL
ncbi:hypothetical protein L914_03142 [Phytophthora nicotianae]|uniref:Uncharacterized protein n=1 Tax=Phytophthora nicotianae TaxID=4792 RepID=W2NY17_PHYNI|nr:hypothetical protein L914_03142 [Phytophthora nicotianae]